jgi:hypothetical protein
MVAMDRSKACSHLKSDDQEDRKERKSMDVHKEEGEYIYIRKEEDGYIKGKYYTHIYMEEDIHIHVRKRIYIYIPNGQPVT